MSEQVKPQLVWLQDGLGGGEHVLVYRASDYAALEAERERLRAQVSALQSDANSWQSGYDKGREDGAKAAEGWKAQHARDSAELRKLCAERDALRAENERLNAQFNECARLFVDATEQACKAQRERDELRAELEAARGLLERVTASVNFEAYGSALHDARQFLAAALTPEVQASGPYASVADALAQRYPKPSLLKDCNVSYSNSSRPLAEQGERQEVVAEYQQLSRYGNWDRVDKAVYGLGKLGDTPEKFRALYTTPQPAPAQDVAEDWSVFIGYLIDKCEGHEISEERLQFWLRDMLDDPHYGALFRREKELAEQPSAIALSIEAAEEEHGSLRAAAKALDVDHGYLSRLKNGDKSNPSDELLAKLGLERLVIYRTAAHDKQSGEVKP